ncbi:MAG: class I SAM-dependent methyltransferase [Candidatus Thioglobus sp.]|nr:class I SAM-dependent methyltransferase [Candidatus Thioglobus sp.]
MKQHSESCRQNQDPILSIIKPLLANTKSVLEVGSGTGQHAVYFSEHMPHLIWQASDQSQYLPGVNAWINDANLGNLPSAIELDVTQPWPDIRVEAIFSANTTHIMGWEVVADLFHGAGQALEVGGLFILYGPFNYQGQYTSKSNADFDLWLKDRDPRSAIRDFEALNQLAQRSGLNLINDFAMPTNNRILYWEKQ